MLLKLNNAHQEHKEKSLIINTELVLSFFEGTNEAGEDVVFIFGVHGNTWQVSNTIDEIMEMAEERGNR
jgi:hypothetical protein